MDEPPRSADPPGLPGVGITGNVFHGPAPIQVSGTQNNHFHINGAPVGPTSDAATLSGRNTEPCPYLGLVPLTAANTNLFRGRSTDVDRVVQALSKASVVVVYGSSGSGKSSLLAAGVVPRVQDQTGRVARIISPGADPVGALQEVIDEWRLTDSSSPDRRLLLVVDQCEQLFSESRTEDVPRYFEMLQAIAGGGTADVRVALVVRSDAHESLLGIGGPLLEDTPQILVTMPSLRDLRLIIEEPATEVGLEVDQLLVDRVLKDVGREPGRLPLLAQALRSAFFASKRGAVTLSGYLEGGGVDGAIERAANDAYTKGLTSDGQRALAREVILRSVAISESDEENRVESRRRVSMEELRGLGSQAELDHVINAFTARQLVVRDVDHIQLAHDALVLHWPVLQEWLRRDRERDRARQSLTRAALQWNREARDAGRLATGTFLAEAIALEQDGRTLLGTVERDFVTASRVRRRRWWAIRATALVALLVVAGAVVVTALDDKNTAQNNANTEQRVAVADQLVEEADNLQSSDPRTALLLNEAAEHLHPSAESQSALTRTLLNTQITAWLPDCAGPMAFSRTGRTLATVCRDTDPHEAAWFTLWDIGDPIHPRRIGQTAASGINGVDSVVFSPDGRTLAAVGTVAATEGYAAPVGDAASAVVLWDISDPAHPHRIGQPLTGLGHLVAFSPDGRLLAAASSADNAVVLWDISDPAHLHRIGQPLADGINGVDLMVLSLNQRTLATVGTVAAVGNAAPAGNAASAVVLWDITDPAHPHRIGQPFTGLGNSVAFSPDGDLMAAASSADNTVVLWDISNPTNPHPTGPPLTGHTDLVTSMAFSSDGRFLATASMTHDVLISDNAVILWDVSDPTQPRRTGQPLVGSPSAGVDGVVFSPVGDILATVSDAPNSYANTTAVILWDLNDHTQPQRIGQPLTGDVSAVAFSPVGHTLATATGEDVTLWDIGDPNHPRRIGQPLADGANSMVFSRDGSTLATTTGPVGDTVILWDIGDLNHPHRIGQILADGIDSVALSSDGHIMATADEDGVVILWDISDRAHPGRIGQPLTGQSDRVDSVAFSPYGETLATADAFHTATLWDIGDLSHPHRIGQLTGDPTSVEVVVFSPDGHTLATADDDATIILWDINDPTHPRVIGKPLADHDINYIPVVVFSPDGRLMAITRADTLTLWDIGNLAYPRPIGQPLTDHNTSLAPLAAFSPDGRTLAAASRENSAVLWDFSGYISIRDRAIEHACAITGGGLKPDEWTQYIPTLPYSDSCA